MIFTFFSVLCRSLEAVKKRIPEFDDNSVQRSLYDKSPMEKEQDKGKTSIWFQMLYVQSGATSIWKGVLTCKVGILAVHYSRWQVGVERYRFNWWYVLLNEKDLCDYICSCLILIFTLFVTKKNKICDNS